MNQMRYTTDEYVTDHDIRQFIEGLQLSFFVKECDKINDYILSLMRSPQPAPNRTIVVTGQGEPPQGLEGVKGVFNILIVYYSHEHIPRESEETEESTIVKKRLGHHNVTVIYTRRKYGTDVRIQINLNEFEPSVVAANEKMLKEVEEDIKKKEDATMLPNTKASGVESDTGSVQKYFDSLSKLPLKNLTAEEIGKVLLDSGVNPLACEATVRILIQKGFIRAIPNVIIARINDKIEFIFGDHVVATNAKRSEKDEVLGFAYWIWLSPRAGYFSYDIANQKETETSNEQIATDTDLTWKKFRERLEAAKLSEQSIDGIVFALTHTAGLKKPTKESVLLCTKSRNVTNVFYSHDGKHVTLTDAENTFTFNDGETLSYSAGHHDAFFISDTTNVKTFEEKMICQHLGVPKITLNLSNGKSIELPFKKEYIKVTEDAVMIHLDCSVGVSLTNKELNSLTGWALTDLNEVEKSRFFVSGREYTVEEFNEKINPRKQEGAVNPGAGSWADIE